MISTSLQHFESVGINELGEAILMERVDRKFHLPLAALNQLLYGVSNYYRILEVAGNRLTTYDTHYYDTSNLDCYHQHHNQRGERFKIRRRSYVESQTSFWEVKARNNKKRTLKTRLASDIDQISHPEISALVQSHSPFQVAGLTTGLRVIYRRITLVSKQSAERITIDLGLRFQLNQALAHFPNLVIIEVKQNRFAASPMVNLLRQANIRPGGLSKYCFGMAYLNPELKQNLFKLQLKQLLLSAYAPNTFSYSGEFPRSN